MKKALYLFLAMALLLTLSGTTACTDRKTDAADSLAVDSLVADTTDADTLDMLISEQPMPKAADELFDDFIFNFAANRKLQMNRIVFPLKETDGSQTREITKKQWRMEHFFMDQGFYTLIFDNRKQMRLVKDTTINHTVIEKIFLDRHKVKRYHFDRINGQWMLTSLENNSMAANANASFLEFYQRFVTDTAFQVRSLHNPVSFTGPNPDDDFSTMSGDIEPETWPAFAPELPANFIYNIVYGQKATGSSQKIFCMRGIANGLEMQLTFKKIGGQWMLTHFSE